MARTSNGGMERMAALCGLALVAWAVTGRSEVVVAGAGSYRTTAPTACKPLPDTLYRTEATRGPMRTGQWWSSLVWQALSQPMFAHPLALRCVDGGLAVSYPGSRVTGNGAGIFGAGVGKEGDLRIGHASVPSFSRADCGGYSDWFVTAVFRSGAAGLQASFGHGSPFVFCRVTAGDATVRFAVEPEVWAGSGEEAVLGVTVNGNHYGLFGASGSTWSGLDRAEFVNHAGGRDYLTIALLPEANRKTLDRFRAYAHRHVTGTRQEFTWGDGVVTTTYHFETEALEGTEGGTLFALYPHQWKYVIGPLAEGTYGSVRGAMKIGEGRGFQTQIPLQGVLPMLPVEGIGDRERLMSYLLDEANRGPARFGDTYWEGKHLGLLASLSGVAEAAGAPELQRIFVAEIQRRLEAWFVATSEKEETVFYYDANWGALVGSRPSYGSDRPLNDHHFHYGYFIRAAAEVARADPSWAERWGPMVELLIRDIASPDRQDTLFPFLRCFDAYAGHSWASGDANFGDGNNQESSSESLNAWYGMVLWGEATGNWAVRDLGLCLFNTERTAVEEYWFDVDGTNFPEAFPEVALGMVWGGKGAFATWFSGDIDCIHGINWLPFTPASLHLGRHPEYVKRNHDRILSVRRGGDDYDTGWGDLVCMFGALENPERSVAHMDAHPKCKVENGNSRAFMYHWIHTLKELGGVDPSVASNHSLTAVFHKDGRRTYAAYNMGEAPLEVMFTDGNRLVARPRALTVESAEPSRSP